MGVHTGPSIDIFKADEKIAFLGLTRCFKKLFSSSKFKSIALAKSIMCECI